MSSHRFTGKRISGSSDLRFIKGGGTYVDDIYLPGVLYAGFIRSPFAHAKLKNIVNGRADNIVDMVTGEEVRESCRPIESIEPITHPNLHVKPFPWYALPTDKVRYVGEPVAMVVANDQYILADAIEAIRFEYEPLPTVASAEDGMSEGTAFLYDEWGDNVMLKFHLQSGDVAESLSNADHIVETKLRMHRQTAAPIENRTYLASFERRSSLLTFWSTTQAPHVMRTFLSQIIDLPESNIRVIQPDVGGAFGRGHPIYPEEILVCILSMRTGRPVKWVGTRSECMMTDHHAREQLHIVRASVKRDGTVDAIDDKMIADMGVFQPTGGIASCLVTAKLIPGPYKIRNYRLELFGISTNKAPFGAYRGFGKETAALVHERIMDLAAGMIGMDPAAIRQKNFVLPEDFPYENATGEKYDSGNYPECFERLLKIIDYDSLRRRQAELRKENQFLGIGLAYTLCPGSLSNRDNLYTGWDSARVVMDPSGYVTVYAGVTSPGTQQQITLAQVTADELGVDIERVNVVEGDTLTCPYGSGNWTDRGATIGASAVMLAARKLKEKITKIAAHVLQVDVDSIDFRDSKAYSRENPSKSTSLSEIAWLAHASPNKLPPDVYPGLSESATFSIPPEEVRKDGRWSLYPIFSNGAAAVVITLDTETLQVKILKYVLVDDSGVLINPAVVDGQLIGAAAQGISGGLYEELIYNESGNLLTSTLTEYLLASATEIPEIEVDHMVIPSPVTPLGTKGAGESGIVAPYPLLCSAFEDALRPFRIEITDMPLRPDKLWKVVRSSISGK